MSVRLGLGTIGGFHVGGGQEQGIRHRATLLIVQRKEREVNIVGRRREEPPVQRN
jgi:hypothetical protein